MAVGCTQRAARWATTLVCTIGTCGVSSAQTMPDYADALPLPLPNDAWVWAGSPPGETGRLFVMEGGGTIRILDIAYPATPGALPVYTLRSTPFLVNTTSQARSLEFAPDFATSGKFYIAHEATGGSRITEFTVSADRNIADPASARLVRHFQSLSFDHALGSIHFWRDGYLYIGVGDGMSSGSGQSITTVNGKVLRIDVKDGADDFPEDANRNYRIPPGNPLVGREGAMPEIWHIGIRNPWRWTFDRWNGDLWMAEVLGGLPGEINHLSGVGTPYMNFGWPAREGNSGSGAINPDFTAATLTFPLLAIARAGGQCSTSGGAIYRGNDIRPWRGRYIWSDYCSARFYSALYDGTTLVDVQEHASQLRNLTTGSIINIPSVSMIAEDGAGELYILQANRGTSSGGAVYRLVPQGPFPPLADVGVAGGLPGADGALDNNDFIAFIDFFFAGDPRADMGVAGGLRGVDQQLDNNDFIVFIDAFFLGQ